MFSVVPSTLLTLLDSWVPVLGRHCPCVTYDPRPPSSDPTVYTNRRTEKTHGSLIVLLDTKFTSKYIGSTICVTKNGSTPRSPTPPNEFL